MARKKPTAEDQKALAAKALAAAFKRQKTLGGLEKLNEAILAKFHGAEGFAEAFYETYDAEDTTGATRARMLSDLIGLQTQLARHAKDDAPADLSDLSDADLAAAMKDALPEACLDDDPTPEEAPAAPHTPPDPWADCVVPEPAPEPVPTEPDADLGEFLSRVPTDPRVAAVETPGQPGTGGL